MTSVADEPEAGKFKMRPKMSDSHILSKDTQVLLPCSDFFAFIVSKFEKMK